VVLAREAVELAPLNWAVWCTLGVAHYRAGDWKAAVAALEKSSELPNGSNSLTGYFLPMSQLPNESKSLAWFFLAMSQQKLGNKQEARPCYDRATQLLEIDRAVNPDLRGFRAEAAQVLGVDGKEDEPGPAEIERAGR
jgi:tetratricopeptide (TPR) repeat protein